MRIIVFRSHKERIHLPSLWIKAYPSRMTNEKIAKAKIEEKEALDKCFRRCLEQDEELFSNRLDQARLDELLAEGEVLIAKENKRVLGAIRCTSLWEGHLFPKTHSYSKSDGVLEGFPYRGERIVYLDFLFVDPSFRRKGKGKELLKTIFSRYETTSFLLLLKEGDPKEYFTRFGFFPLYGDYGIESMENATLYVRPYTKTGICSDPAF